MGTDYFVGVIELRILKGEIIELSEWPKCNHIHSYERRTEMLYLLKVM